MALKVLNPGINPLGQFDCLDADVANIKGGEVLKFGAVSFSADVGTQDGYVVSSGVKRTVVKLAKDNDGYGPYMLADEGVAGYGTLFGTVVGATLGRTAYGPNSTVPAGSLLGPHTATGSGKVTAWDKPGLYAVSLDAVDSAKLVPSATLAVGTALHFSTDNGKLTTASGTNASTAVVGSLVGFETNGSLVSTPNNLISALNYGTGAVTGGANGQFAFLTFHFNPYGS